MDKKPRSGMIKNHETKKARCRRYRIHRKLKNWHHQVNARERMVIKRDNDLTQLEVNWLRELMQLGYTIQNPII